MVYYIPIYYALLYYFWVKININIMIKNTFVLLWKSFLAYIAVRSNPFCIYYKFCFTSIIYFFRIVPITTISVLVFCRVYIICYVLIDQTQIVPKTFFDCNIYSLYLNVKKKWLRGVLYDTYETILVISSEKHFLELSRGDLLIVYDTIRTTHL